MGPIFLVRFSLLLSFVCCGSESLRNRGRQSGGIFFFLLVLGVFGGGGKLGEELSPRSREREVENFPSLPLFCVFVCAQADRGWKSKGEIPLFLLVMCSKLEGGRRHTRKSAWIEWWRGAHARHLRHRTQVFVHGGRALEEEEVPYLSVTKA